MGDEQAIDEQAPAPRVTAPDEAPTSYYEWREVPAPVSLFALAYSLVVWVVMVAVWLFIAWCALHAGMGG